VPARWLAEADDPRPAWPASSTTTPTPRRRWLVPLLAAAAVLLAFSVQRGLARRDLADLRAFQAGAQPDPADPQPVATRATRLRNTRPCCPRLRRTRLRCPRLRCPRLRNTARNPRLRNTARNPRLATQPATHDSATRDAAARPAPRTGDAPTGHAPRESLDDLLARLDDEAEACMQAGDLACADARYREIVQRGGRRVQVELAFADRFHLARQRGADDVLRKLWTTYLTRFPRGQFADDARGGLCRHAGAQQPACWRAYLADFPAGSFAAEASKAGGGE
jgi:hypothetical protein